MRACRDIRHEDDLANEGVGERLGASVAACAGDDDAEAGAREGRRQGACEGVEGGLYRPEGDEGVEKCCGREGERDCGEEGLAEGEREDLRQAPRRLVEEDAEGEETRLRGRRGCEGWHSSEGWGRRFNRSGDVIYDLCVTEKMIDRSLHLPLQ